MNEKFIPDLIADLENSVEVVQTEFGFLPDYVDGFADLAKYVINRLKNPDTLIGMRLEVEDETG